MAEMNESAENYLETILVLQRRNGRVRSVDIANELDFSRPSVSVSMKKLRENGSIEIDERGFITLTGEGKREAERVYERHEVLARALVAIGVSEKTALADACRIEHVISRSTFDKLKEYINKAEKKE